jgi:general secretion pathway protein C
MTRLFVACLMTVGATVRAQPDPPLLPGEEPLQRCVKLRPGKRYMWGQRGEVELSALVAFAGTAFCRPLVVPARVLRRGGTVSIYAPEPLTPDEMYRLFVTALKSVGLTVEAQGPGADAPLLIMPGKNYLPEDVDRPPSHATPPERPESRPSAPPDERPDSQALVDAHVRCTGHTCTLDRVLLDHLLANTTSLATAARFVPSIRDGRPNGFKLYAIRPGSIFGRLGFQNGDTVKTVNGLDMSTPEAVLGAYTKVRNASHLTIALERRGEPLTLEISIQ